jgi:hypothetical protein
MKPDYLKWYTQLTIHQKINLRQICILICGIEWIDLQMFFPFFEGIEILYHKLKKEGII